jgi:hypothetical protein
MMVSCFFWGCEGCRAKANMNTVELPAHFIVWLLSAEAAFLRSRMVWANWDVEELKGMEGKITADPAFLNIGMQGWPYSVPT